MPKYKKPKPNYLLSVLNLRCPRCRRGHMFRDSNFFRNFRWKHALADMYNECPVCGQVFQLEPGFWLGTAYVSYALNVAFSTFTFFVWWITIGFSFEDNRLVYWLITNGVLVFLIQPFIMRLSRLLFLNLFVHYNENYDTEDTYKYN